VGLAKAHLLNRSPPPLIDALSASPCPRSSSSFDQYLDHWYLPDLIRPKVSRAQYTLVFLTPLLGTPHSIPRRSLHFRSPFANFFPTVYLPGHYDNPCVIACATEQFPLSVYLNANGAVPPSLKASLSPSFPLFSPLWPRASRVTAIAALTYWLPSVGFLTFS